MNNSTAGSGTSPHRPMYLTSRLLSGVLDATTCDYARIRTAHLYRLLHSQLCCCCFMHAALRVFRRDNVFVGSQDVVLRSASLLRRCTRHSDSWVSAPAAASQNLHPRQSIAVEH